MEIFIAIIVGLAVGAILGRVLARRAGLAPDPEAVARVRAEAEQQVAQARREAEVAAREEAVRLTAETEREIGRQRQEFLRREERLHKKEEAIDQKADGLAKKESIFSKREKDLQRREKKVEKSETDIEAALVDARSRLETVAGIRQDEARAILVAEVREDARKQSIEQIRAVEREAKVLADERARMIVAAAIQRYASEHVVEKTVAVVALPSEDMKGRIIGREGRNIRAFEAATGCDLVIDDTPDAVVVSCFNPVRREVGRLVLERVLADGRVHPARIEELTGRARQEVEQQARQHGERAMIELELSGLHPELVKHLGRLHFRSSFAQNVLQHSIEVGHLTGLMASELGLNVKEARRAGLLHDIGKAVDQDAEGPHALVGASLCKKYNESKAVVHAVAAHHEYEAAGSVLAHLVAGANALSASRPGARREQLEGYIKRLDDLEALAGTFPAVERVHAIQFGREVRVMVENAKLNDQDAELLARDIARKIESDLTYPGEVRVTVIRETRAVQYAR
ncbi:MAG: ribonuclease Y [Bradymonadia bacterium]|jgi:ribonuclease Y